MVAELAGVAKAFGGRTLIRDFTTRILAGDRIGLIGPNGAGKTTLLKLILGEIAPDAGTVRRGANLAVAYFDQLREALDPDATVQGTISPGADWIEIGSERRHVIGYLGDFLFAPERARSPVRSLSGGERNRLLLARLFARPANVLVLDEPTNDLDIETLELLESLLQDYRGTIFLVSHDRAFLDNVVTQVIAFEGDGALREYAGGYSDWAEYQARHGEARGRASAPRAPARAPVPGTAAAAPGVAPSAGKEGRERRRGLSFNDQRELAALPARIEAGEARIAEIRGRLAEPALYRDAPQEIGGLRAELAALEADVAADYDRWEMLESRAAAAARP
jgi:ATP-binding cassette subfamily F protein uup